MLVAMKVYLAVTVLQISIERFRLLLLFKIMNKKNVLKSILLPFLGCTLLLFAPTSCGGEDDGLSAEEKQELEREAELASLKQKIIGTWAAVKYYSQTFGKYMDYHIGTRDTISFYSDGSYIYKGLDLAIMGDPSYWKYEITNNYHLILKADYFNKEYPFTIYGESNDTLRFVKHEELVRIK